jgi:hypothetical protein
MGAAAQQQQQQAPPAGRMNLGRVVRGRQEVPDRVLIYGVEGVGKSSWAAAAPNPIFVPAEEGTDQLNVERFPKPERWSEVLDAIEQLRAEKHDYRTVAFDTLDALEPLLWRHICDRDKKESIESYGYGKGYVAALDEWRVFLSALERLRRERSMSIVLIAHTLIRPFKNPEGEDYDRYELKLNAKAGGLLKEWCDSVLFAHWETFASKSGDSKAKGVSTGARIASTERTAAWDAKNRYALPQSIPLDFEEYARAKSAHAPKPVEELKASIARKLELLTDQAVKERAVAFIAKAGDNAAELAKADNHLTALTERKES